MSCAGQTREWMGERGVYGHLQEPTKRLKQQPEDFGMVEVGCASPTISLSSGQRGLQLGLRYCDCDSDCDCDCDSDCDSDLNYRAVTALLYDPSVSLPQELEKRKLPNDASWSLGVGTAESKAVSLRPSCLLGVDDAANASSASVAELPCRRVGETRIRE